MVAEADRQFGIVYLNALAKKELGYTNASLEEGINLLDILQLIAHVYLPDDEHFGDPPNYCPPYGVER